MVSREIIESVLEKSFITNKCYPKLTALEYYEKNKDNFKTETYPSGVISETIPSPVGYLQQAQADLQEDVDYESLEVGVLHDYSTNSFIPLGMYHNGVPDWEQRCRFVGYDFGDGFVMAVRDRDANNGEGAWVDVSIPRESEILSHVIDKSPRVQTDCTVYRYGEFPLDVEVGGHGKFKGFQSTSYNPFVSFRDIPEGGGWVQGEKDVRYKMTIHVMHGTKGVVLNEHNGCAEWQSELLLDKGQRYVVLARDDVNKTAEILLY